jgi:hypothetical protein
LKLRVGPLALPYYFVLANAASLMGMLKFIVGGSHVVWTPIRNAGPAIQRTSQLASAGVAGVSRQLSQMQESEAANSTQ